MYKRSSMVAFTSTWPLSHAMQHSSRVPAWAPEAFSDRTACVRQGVARAMSSTESEDELVCASKSTHDSPDVDLELVVCLPNFSELNFTDT